MANISIIRGKTLPDSSSKSDFHDLIDLATASITSLTGDDITGSFTSPNKVAGSSLYNLYSIASGASIPNHSVAPILLASHVSGRSLFNLSSLSSLAGVVPSYVLPSIATPGKISGESLYALASTPINQGLFPYKSIVSSLASGSQIIYDGSSSFVGKQIEGNTSNVIFSWNGCEYSAGLVITSSSIVDISTAGKYSYIRVHGDTYQTILTSKFKKLQGISTITAFGKIWSFSGITTESANLNIDIGGEDVTLDSGTNQTPTWISDDIDVSGLSNGTTYDITIKLKSENNGRDAFCIGVVLIAS